MTTTIYSLNEIENISWSNEHNLLPEETIAIINLISEQVGAPSYVRTPLFPNNNDNDSDDEEDGEDGSADDKISFFD